MVEWAFARVAAEEAADKEEAADERTSINSRTYASYAPADSGPAVPPEPSKTKTQDLEEPLLLNNSHDITFSARQKEYDTTEALFSSLLILSATFGSFAHGSNDVSNAIGPIAAVYDTWLNGGVSEASATPIWLLGFGAVGIVIGLAVWGRRVMETVGTKITVITPSSGFCIEIGAALTVLIASRIQIPVSTTHCKVGSVVFVGYMSTGKVSWRLFGKIVSSWVATVPVAAGLAAAMGGLIFYVFLF